MTKNILIINGPNLNMLGTRQPEIYGSHTLADIESMCHEKAMALSLSCTFVQSNDEGQLIQWIQEASSQAQGVIINAAGYTHTSVAIGDALMNLDIPVIELHLSNIFKREAFRHHSYVSGAAQGVICGFGAEGYPLALEAIAKLI